MAKQSNPQPVRRGGIPTADGRFPVEAPGFRRQRRPHFDVEAEDRERAARNSERKKAADEAFWKEALESPDTLPHFFASRVEVTLPLADRVASVKKFLARFDDEAQARADRLVKLPEEEAKTILGGHWQAADPEWILAAVRSQDFAKLTSAAIPPSESAAPPLEGEGLTKPETPDEETQLADDLAEDWANRESENTGPIDAEPIKPDSSKPPTPEPDPEPSTDTPTPAGVVPDAPTASPAESVPDPVPDPPGATSVPSAPDSEPKPAAKKTAKKKSAKKAAKSPPDPKS